MWWSGREGGECGEVGGSVVEWEGVGEGEGDCVSLSVSRCVSMDAYVCSPI